MVLMVQSGPQTPVTSAMGGPLWEYRAKQAPRTIPGPGCHSRLWVTAAGRCLWVGRSDAHLRRRQAYAPKMTRINAMPPINKASPAPVHSHWKNVVSV